MTLIYHHCQQHLSAWGKGMRKIATCVALATLLSAPALAIAESGKTISHVGVQSGQAYVMFTVPPSGGCSFNDIYLDINTDAGKAYYTLLVTAYSQGKPLSRIDYHNSSGTCYVDLVEM